MGTRLADFQLHTALRVGCISSIGARIPSIVVERHKCLQFLCPPALLGRRDAAQFRNCACIYLTRKVEAAGAIGVVEWVVAAAAVAHSGLDVVLRGGEVING